MSYFDTLNKYNNNEYLKVMEKYAEENNVPIMKSDGLDCLVGVIKATKSKKILEVGTAIGYSSSIFALQDKDIHIDTIERNEKMYQEAIKNINILGLNDQINVYFADALEIDNKLLSNDYDLIFIDAAKAQYKNFFLKYEVLLKDKGIIFTDNLLFHGMIDNPTGKESRDLKQLLRKIRTYNDWLKDYDKFDTTFLRIGDGIAISVKK